MRIGETIVRRSTRFALAGLVQAALALAVLAAPAAAATTHSYVGQLGGGGSAPGSFSNIQGVALDPVSGDLFVADQGNNRVQRITPAGDPVAQWNELSSGIAGVAVDAANDRVYVTEQWSNTVAVFDTSGASLGELTPGSGWGAVNSVAVDPGTGVVYVTDSANNLVQVFDATGASLDSFGGAGSGDGEFSGPTGVAVDPTTHDVYVIDSGNSRIERFSAAGVTFVESISDPNGLLAVAVDPANGDLYVGESSPSVQVAQYDDAGNRLDTFGAGRLGWISGIGVSQSTHKVYVSDPYEASVKIFVPVTVATVTTEGASAITATGATLEGTINPEGTTVYSEYVELGLDTGYGRYAYGEQYGLTGTSDVPITVQIPESEPLQPNATYHYRLVAETSLGKFAGSDQIFTTEGAPPAVGSTWAYSGSETATLHAQINPNNSATSYHFEYGLTESYGSSTPDESAGSTYGENDSTAEISGLQPGTLYHYRVVADNGVGSPTASADRTFRTAAATAPYASEIGGASATLNGVAYLQGSSTFRFEYGTDTSYGSSTPEILRLASGEAALSSGVKGLEPATTYHFRFVVNSGGNTTASDDGTFTTLPAADVVTGDATDVGTSSATLHGIVDTHGSPGTYQFVVTGVGSSVFRMTPPQPLTSAAPMAVAAQIDSLPNGGTYSVRLEATVGGVKSAGGDRTFVTQAAQPLPRPAAAPNDNPYGCVHPVLMSPGRKAVPGRAFTLAGSDLGVAGRVSIRGVGERSGSAWSAGAVTFSVPKTKARKLIVSVDCGKESNSIALRLRHPHRKHAR
jgi:DNA-binding beta-propeller fold protein YncE